MYIFRNCSKILGNEFPYHFLEFEKLGVHWVSSF